MCSKSSSLKWVPKKSFLGQLQMKAIDSISTLNELKSFSVLKISFEVSSMRNAQCRMFLYYLEVHDILSLSADISFLLRKIQFSKNSVLEGKEKKRNQWSYFDGGYFKFTHNFQDISSSWSVAKRKRKLFASFNPLKMET